MKLRYKNSTRKEENNDFYKQCPSYITIFIHKELIIEKSNVSDLDILKNTDVEQIITKNGPTIEVLDTEIYATSNLQYSSRYFYNIILVVNIKLFTFYKYLPM